MKKRILTPEQKKKKRTKRLIDLGTFLIILSLFLGIIIVPDMKQAYAKKDKDHFWNFAIQIVEGPQAEVYKFANNEAPYKGLLAAYSGVYVAADTGASISALQDSLAQSLYGMPRYMYCNAEMKATIDAAIKSTMQSEDVVGTSFNGIMTVLLIIAIFWAIIVAFMHMFQDLERGNDMIVALKKTGMELIIVIVLIMLSDTILSAVNSLGYYVASFATPSSSAAVDEETLKAADLVLKSVGVPQSENTESYGKAVNVKVGSKPSDLGDFEQLGPLLTLLVPWIAAYAIKIVTIFAILQAVVEIAIRRILSPLAFADIYQEGLRSPGARGLKKLLAAYFKLLICVIVAKLSSTLLISLGNAASNGGGSYYIFMVLAIDFTLITTMLKGGEYVNDFLGV